jgi:Na+/phosphate symporter
LRLIPTPHKKMSNHDVTLNLEHLLRALREVQSLTPKIFTGDTKTQIDLPEPIVTRTREEALRMGVSAEVLIVALLQAFNDADESFKKDLEKVLSSVLHAGEAKPSVE